MSNINGTEDITDTFRPSYTDYGWSLEEISQVLSHNGKSSSKITRADGTVIYVPENPDKRRPHQVLKPTSPSKHQKEELTTERESYL